jgi:ERCC4-type nuclease
MEYIIKFDNREKDLIKLFELKEHKYTLENLDIGDIQFIDSKTNEILILIERKTLADLYASIKDGRYKEQKERMLHSIKKNIRKIILIEGEYMEQFTEKNCNDMNVHCYFPEFMKENTLPQSTLSSVIINTMIRDNIHIHICKNINETVQFIENIILQIPKYYSDLQNEIILEQPKIFQNEYNCSTTKKENITQKICFRNMLSQIPGISNSIASVIVEKYENMENFITTMKTNGNNDKKSIVKLIGLEQHGKNNRKVGDKTGEKIYLFLFSI